MYAVVVEHPKSGRVRRISKVRTSSSDGSGEERPEASSFVMMREARWSARSTAAEPCQAELSKYLIKLQFNINIART